MILLIDNYDSFTYNLVQMIAPHQTVKVVRNDAPELFQWAEQAQAIVISPGPGTPSETGKVPAVIRQFYQLKPMLGICLGHQAIGEVFGGKITSAQKIRHGKQSIVRQTNQSRLFQGISEVFPVMRYHSLVIQRATVPVDFEITALATDDHEIMAMEHRNYPVFGLQFHPESIGTPEGKRLIQNFIQFTQEAEKNAENF